MPLNWLIKTLGDAIMDNLNEILKLQTKKYEIIKEMVYATYDTSIDLDALEKQVIEINNKLDKLRNDDM